MEWNEDLINQIRADKQKEKSEDRDNLLSLTSHSLYGEKIHYALELIQNAEDEAAESITFIFSKDDIIILNNGNPFDKKDVWRICSVKSGGKKKKIGFFGIGFKSVFNITKTPQIISGEFNFEIENYVYPKTSRSLPENVKEYYRPEKGAIFILPYSPELSTPSELIENFNLIDDKILLFLNLKELKFIEKINNSAWTIKKKLEEDLIFLQNTHTGQETKWKVFSKPLPVDNLDIVPRGKEGIEDTRIIIAFPIEKDIRGIIKKSGVVYCYLPTKKRTDLSFLIQADFLPTIGRENIAEHPWNIWLMKELGILTANSIDQIKNDRQFADFIYEFIPLREEIQDDIVRPLYDSFYTSIEEKGIAKTTKGWIKAVDCVIPADDKIRHILSEDDLEFLFGARVFYIAPEASERAKTVLLELGAKKVGPKEVASFLKNEDEIKKKSKEWFLDLYDYLATVFDTGDRGRWEEDTKLLFEDIEKSRFILADDEKLVSLRDPAKPDRLICYPQSINLPEIHQIFTEDEIVFLNRYFQKSNIAHRKEDENEEKRERVKKWFDSVGVKQYFKQVHVIKDVILPKFATGKYTQYDDLKLYKLADYIRTYWSNIESEINNKKISADFIKEIRDTFLLKAFCYKNGNKIEEYKKPAELYLSERYGKSDVMEILFNGIDNIHFLSSYYLNREKREEKKIKRGRQKAEYTWRRFFEILEVWNSPRVMKVNNWSSIVGKEGYEWIKKEYSPRGAHDIYGDSYSDDIRRLVEYCSQIKDCEEIKKRMISLWESLEKNWKFYKDKEYCRTIYKWFHYSENPRNYETSSFLEFLRQASWVPAEDGKFYRPSELFADTPKNRLLLGEDAKYVSLKANESFLKDLMVRIEPTIEEVIAHLKWYKERNLQPAENKAEKMKEIDRFLQSKINDIENMVDKENKLKGLREAFNEHELLYLPREDRAWWAPIHVFWKDFSDSFETLRGYVEHKGTVIYDTSLKDFFSLLGVIENPLVKQCLDFLEELKAKGDLLYYKRFVDKIYAYIDNLIRRGIEEKADWNREIFLSENGLFLAPSELYFNDDNEFKEYFGPKIEILWLPFSWVNNRHMLQVAGFKRLSKNISVVKKIDDLRETEGGNTNQLMQRLSCVENYLKKKNAELYWELEKEGVFNKIRELEVYETPKITLDYFLVRENSERVVVNTVEKEAYYSNEENRLYKSNQIALFSTSVAKELSKLFGLGAEEAFPLLDSFLNTSNEDELDGKLKYFNIQLEEVSKKETREEVRLKSLGEQRGQEVVEGVKREEPEPQEDTSIRRPQLPDVKSTPEEHDLIDPNEFIFDVIEEHTPYSKTDGIPEISVKEIKLKDGHSGSGGPQRDRQFKERATRVDAEELALEMVMRFEEIEERRPDDRHKQRKIGYDIFSKAENGEERFIEVKHFREEPGTWELDHYQWKKAEQERDKFFVYVVSGLKKKYNPTIDVIKNPIKYLSPDPPIQKKFSDWKNGIVKVVKCQKV